MFSIQIDLTEKRIDEITNQLECIASAIKEGYTSGYGYDLSEESEMTHDDFVDILVNILEEDGIRHILTIPGVYEILSEEYHDDILETWERNEDEAKDE